MTPELPKAELLPCPFCDGQNHKPELRNGLNEWWVHCTNCDCSSKMCMSAGSAIHVWNRRTSPTASDALEAVWQAVSNRGLLKGIDGDLHGDIKEDIGSALATPQADGWQDISTAPKDGAHIIIATETGHIYTGWWSQTGSRWQLPFCGAYDSVLAFKDATHWRPLPQPPQKKEKTHD